MTRCLVCDCEGTMPLDAKALERPSDGTPGGRPSVERIHRQLCRAELDAFEAALGGPLTVACTQEAPLFAEVAEERGAPVPTFVNIRETAGWSAEAKAAHPKIAALLATATRADTPARLKTVESDGLCLVIGAGQAALEAARMLAPRLSVTLLLTEASDVLLPPVLDFAIHRGRVVGATGSFGAFELTVDGHAPMLPSSRAEPDFALPRDGARTRCSLILDMRGGTPLFAGHAHRDGYARVDPGDPAAVLSAALKLADMVGTFDKPIYVANDTSICAHSRSAKTGCSRCLEVCPAGAIAPAGDHVAVDPGICGGCGQCHAVCPTGAIEYRYPPRADLIGRPQALLAAYAQAGGRDAVLLVHDAAGGEFVNAMARRGRGLPAHVIPLALHSSTVPGHVEMLAWVAAGAAGVAVLVPPVRADETAGLEGQAELAETILDGLGLGLVGLGRCHVICEADPDAVEERLWSLRPTSPTEPRSFAPVGGKRDVARTVFATLAPDHEGIVPLMPGAPYGRVLIDRDACTLCMACTGACPTGAIADTPGEPRLRFTEAACVQCGLCVSTCPEDALALEPRLNLAPAAQAPVTLNEEEPFACTACGKPFATRSAIERVAQRLEGHAMFAGEKARLFELCETCRVEAMANSADDPFRGAARPRVRTTMDYQAGRLGADDFLIED